MSRRSRFSALFAVPVVAAAFALAPVTSSAHPRPMALQESQPKIEIPKTPEEHQKLAEMYRQKAAEYRAEAEEHRKMLADYRKRSYQPKSSMEAGDIKKMRLHCQRYIRAAENHAAEAEEMAKHHELRAKEF
jgi:hypothetical protein